MSIGESYPAIAEHMILHLTPREGCLRDIRLAPSTHREDTRMLNNLSAELLSRCDGRTPLALILAEVAALFTGEGFDLVGSCREHLAEMMKDGVVDLYPAPVDKRGRITGSREHESPSHFMIELTDRCNLRCAHCYRESSPECYRQIPTERLIKIIDQMADHGVSTIELTGGEPTMRPGFMHIFEHCARRFATVALVTNGWFIDDGMARRMGRAVNAIVQIDLDGSHAKPHDCLRGRPGAFERARNAARALKRHGVRFRAAMNVYAGNFHTIRDTAALAKEVGATWFSFSPVVDLGRGRGAETITYDQMLDLMPLARELETEYGSDFVRIADDRLIQRAEKEGNCGAGWRSLVLGPDGHVRPCVMVNPAAMSLGNLLEQEYGEFIRTFDGAFFRGLKAPGPEYCADCSHGTYCLGCFARTFRAMEVQRLASRAPRCAWREETGFGRYLHADAVWDAEKV